jgi:YHS domain-containing protein
MHGIFQSAPDSAALAEKMAIDPVCRMTIDPAAAAAREVFEGKPVYFCSEGCRHRFLANPTAYAAGDGRRPAMLFGLSRP